MRNNFEKFISGEVLVSLTTSKEVSKFIYTMTYLNFSSILDIPVEEIKINACKGYCVEYVPGEGFVFDFISNINALTYDMYANIEVISLKELFGNCITMV